MTDEQQERKNKPAYIARCKDGCGQIIFAAVDIPEHAQDIAHDVSDLIKNGYSIERVTVGYVHEKGFGCKCKKEKEVCNETI